jgi:D-aminoacyl-tRNA deacylase
VTLEPAEPPTRYLVVVSEPDPVAHAVGELWGTPPSTGDHVDGSPIRVLSEEAYLLRRPSLHIHDERLDVRLPAHVRASGSTLVFPSIHRSERNVPCLTVHPLGNPGATAEVGGRPRTLDPTDPRRMAAALRALSEQGTASGLEATYEATHHGPELDLPAMFVEIGYGTDPSPPSAAVRVLANVIPRLVPDPSDRVALALGGGHYAPHFTDLARKRHWAFGHILSRHALATLDAEVARSAYERSGGAEGWIAARAEDAGHSALRGLGSRLRDAEAASREGPREELRGASGT